VAFLFTRVTLFRFFDWMKRGYERQSRGDTQPTKTKKGDEAMSTNVDGWTMLCLCGRKKEELLTAWIRGAANDSVLMLVDAAAGSPPLWLADPGGLVT
jgi:hypothetical protein